MTIARLKELIAWSLALALIAVLGIFIFQSYYPYEPIRIDKIEVSSTNVKRGQIMWFCFVGEKFYNVPVRAQVELTDGRTYALMSYTSTNPIGVTFKPRPFIVPYHVVPGRYRLKWTGSYDMNPVNTVVKVAYSDTITIN
jgi:hypothetical protein